MIVQALSYTHKPMPSLLNLKEVIETQFLAGSKISEAEFNRQAKAALSAKLIETLESEPSANFLNSRVRLPAKTLFAESEVSIADLQKLAEMLPDFLAAAPELNYTFRVSLSAQGNIGNDAVVQKLNDLLSNIQRGWKFQ